MKRTPMSLPMNLLIFFSWFSYGAVLTQAFNCYECWSVMVPGCGEPFKSDAAGVTVKSATSNQSCIALRETHVDGNEGIARAVVDLTECTFGSVQLVLLNIFIWYAWFTILLGIASSELIKINIQLDAASRVKRTEVSILKHHSYSEEQGSILDIVIKAMHLIRLTSFTQTGGFI
ncbi:unnamed protein product [Rotaria socialis]|uniref:Uncharacterized protein n=1 Tax=Rotaria socialis TaxID=392032 RepID=A0A820J7I2_9BILA|nr:unnamed protein product [Rotaria socialis]CAF4390088.1 unnamed protein product [Rotaria socialis]CAF4668727.1 unnamed protein product [Rotaria socialis]